MVVEILKAQWVKVTKTLVKKQNTATRFNNQKTPKKSMPCVANAPVDQVDQDGQTPLMRACEQQDEEKVKELLNKGARVLLKNCQGETALDIAIKKQHVKIINILSNHLKHLKKGYEL